MIRFDHADFRSVFTDYTYDEYSLFFDALATILAEKGEKSVVVGYDTRLSSPLLANLLIESLLKRGINVHSSLACESSCLFYYRVLNHNSAGIMVTASHNPGSYNGLKLVKRGLVPVAITSIADRLYHLMEYPENCGKKRGSLFIEDLLSEYIDKMILLSGFSGRRNLKVIVDGLHGVSVREQGCCLARFPKLDVEYLHPVPDGSFPAGDPNPQKQGSLEALKSRLSTGNYDLGFAFDGDGDRLALFSSDGRRIESYQILTRVADYLSPDARLLLDAKTPLQILKDSGAGLCKTGHVFIKKSLSENSEYLAGCEGSGHFFYSVPGGVLESSLLGMLYILRYMDEHEEGFSSAVKELDSMPTGKEISVRFSDPDRVTGIVEEHFRELGAEIIDRDFSDEPLGCSLIVMPEYQLYQRVSQTEKGLTRWQITEYKKGAADDAYAFLNKVISKEEKV